MMDEVKNSHMLNIDPVDYEKKYEDIFFFESPTSDFNIPMNEEAFIMPYRMSDSLSKTNPSTINLNKHNQSVTNLNDSGIELKRKKNREASKISRQKKKKDIICLVKTNEILKEKIKALTIQLNNNLCVHCKKNLANQSSEETIKEILIKTHHLASISTSSSSLNPSPIRAKTAMFISMVVLFCVIVNSFGDKRRNYLRKVTINNYYNDYFNLMSSEIVNNITQCFDLLKYHYSLNSPPIPSDSLDNQNIQIEILDNANTTLDCQRLVINQQPIQEKSEDNVNSINVSTTENRKFKVIANRDYFINQLFEDNNVYQEERNKSHYFHLQCIELVMNTTM